MEAFIGSLWDPGHKQGGEGAWVWMENAWPSAKLLSPPHPAEAADTAFPGLPCSSSATVLVGY